MPAVQLDLRGLAAQQPPSRRHVASVVDDAEAVHVLGPVPALAAVLTRLWRKERLPAVPVSWQPADDPASTGLARALQLGSGTERDLPLVRDDHGGGAPAPRRGRGVGGAGKGPGPPFGGPGGW